ncbi:MAG: hypothetical protein WBV96_22315 [Polyangia bacterium]
MSLGDGDGAKRSLGFREVPEMVECVVEPICGLGGRESALVPVVATLGKVDRDFPKTTLLIMLLI